MLRLLHKSRMLSASASSPIGFIGLGNMGAHMARNLIKAGHSVIVYDLNASAVDSLKQAGAKVEPRTFNFYALVFMAGWLHSPEAALPPLPSRATGSSPCCRPGACFHSISCINHI